LIGCFGSVGLVYCKDNAIKKVVPAKSQSTTQKPVAPFVPTQVSPTVAQQAVPQASVQATPTPALAVTMLNSPSGGCTGCRLVHTVGNSQAGDDTIVCNSCKGPDGTHIIKGEQTIDFAFYGLPFVRNCNGQLVATSGTQSQDEECQPFETVVQSLFLLTGCENCMYYQAGSLINNPHIGQVPNSYGIVGCAGCANNPQNWPYATLQPDRQFVRNCNGTLVATPGIGTKEAECAKFGPVAPAVNK